VGGSARSGGSTAIRAKACRGGWQHIGYHETVAFGRLANGHIQRVGELWSVDDEGMEFAVLAAGVGAFGQRLQ
jgi:hypothetical protein